MENKTVWCYYRRIKQGDEFLSKYSSQEEAEKQGDFDWNRLTKHDKDRTAEAWVGEYELDEEGEPDMMIGTTPTLVFK